MAMDIQQKIRTEPRISVSKLGEYIDANPLRQRSLLLDQKYPAGFIVPRYTPAEHVIKTYLAAFPRNDDPLVQAYERLINISTGTQWEVDQAKLCAEAVLSFAEVADELWDGGFTFRPSDNDVPLLSVAGVDISVRPEVLVEHKERGYRGAAKIYFSKTYPLSAESSAAYATTVVHQWAGMLNPPSGLPLSHKACLLVDVFAKKIHYAPASFKSRMKHVDAACQTITAVWPTLKK
jgi:hypothetical protein